jgi:hypothetical protein
MGWKVYIEDYDLVYLINLYKVNREESSFKRSI